MKHSVAADGGVQVGLGPHLGFNINSEAVTYVTSMQSENDVSVLKLILTSYCVSQMALD